MSARPPRSLPPEPLRGAEALLRSGRAASAERMLRALEAGAPGDPRCRWLLGVAVLDQNRHAESIAALEHVLAQAPDFVEARVDLARALRAAGRPADARAIVRTVLERLPQHHLAWLAYGDILVDLEQYADARTAFERARLTDPERERIAAATTALLADDRKQAEEIFREILKRDPSHAAALCGLAAVSLAADVPRDAERLLRHAQKRSPHLPLIWRGLGTALLALGQLEAADAAARYLVRIEPDGPQSWIALAAASARLLRQEDALAAYEQAARLQPKEVRLRTSMGHVLKTLGRRKDSEAAYKAALELLPAHAEAWWSLADLKNYVFSDAEIAAMQALLAAGTLADADVAQLEFALGKAFEHRRDYPAAFACYARGNALKRRIVPFSIEAFERRAERIRSMLSREFFAARAGCGDPSQAPIFIVGLPRSGSTLIEQILASHSAVEGTMELPNILGIARDFDDLDSERAGYPSTVVAAPREAFAALGRRYLAETRPLRQGRPRFTDKLPNNFSHVGLIHLILPNATVIDARRHPMDACFSTYKQHFAEGQAFSYDLEVLGRYYRSYLALIDHWNAVLPGKVLTVQYEELVADPEAGIRRLLAHCGLPFEPACLEFHATERAVRTASAEQVRQPIYTSGVGYWRHFEHELEPLRRALGDSLGRFPSYK